MSEGQSKKTWMWVLTLLQWVSKRTLTSVHFLLCGLQNIFLFHILHCYCFPCACRWDIIISLSYTALFSHIFPTVSVYLKQSLFNTWSYYNELHVCIPFTSCFSNSRTCLKLGYKFTGPDILHLFWQVLCAKSRQMVNSNHHYNTNKCKLNAAPGALPSE